MIGATWHWTILGFAASFFFSWFLFAIIWYLVAYAHGKKTKTLIILNISHFARHKEKGRVD